MVRQTLIELAGPTTAQHVESSAGNLLRRARSKRGWSQRELALAAGVPQSTVSRIESSTVQPTLPVLQQIMIAMGFELRIAIEPFDDHDRVLDARASEYPDRQRALQTAQDKFARLSEGAERDAS